MLVSDMPTKVRSMPNFLAVLILVLVDVGLGPHKQESWVPDIYTRLNPCFSGCWSRTQVH